MHLTLVKTVVLVIVLAVVLVDNVNCGKTIKKHSASYKKQQVALEEEEGVESAPPVKPSKAKSGLASKEIKEANLSENDSESTSASSNSTVKTGSRNCTTGSDGTVKCKRMKPTSAVVVNPAFAGAQAAWHHPQRPVTLFDLYWRHRINAANQKQLTSQRLLPHLQKATLDMAKGILTGMGWELQSWELDLLESITKKVTRDFMFIFQFLF